eukprot:4189094-Pyramimonas_sp.AAC.1
MCIRDSDHGVLPATPASPSGLLEGDGGQAHAVDPPDGPDRQEARAGAHRCGHEVGLRQDGGAPGDALLHGRRPAQGQTSDGLRELHHVRALA